LLEQVAFQVNPSLREIAECAFRGCSSLTSFRIPASVNKLGLSCFAECNALTNIVVEFGSTLAPDIDWFFEGFLVPRERDRPVKVHFESLPVGILDETYGEYGFPTDMDDDFLEGWNQCAPA
jgi:hypothetical protein